MYSQLIFDKDPKTLNEERIVTSVNGVEKTVYSHAKERIWTPISHQSQKLTRHGIKTKM